MAKRSNRSTLLMVEDEPIMRSYLELILSSECERLLIAEDIFEAQQHLQNHHPDVVILDMLLKHGDSLTFCQLLRQQDPLLPVIMVSGSHLLAHRLACLNAGADLFLAKPFATEELRHYVRRFLTVTRLQRPQLTRPVHEALHVGPLQLIAAGQQAYFHGTELPLTPTEFQLLWQLALNPGQVVSREQLSQVLWPVAQQRGLRSIDNLILRLRKKLEPSLLETVHRKGYRLKIAESL